MVGCFLIRLVMLMLVLIRLAVVVVVVVVVVDDGSAVVYMLDLGPKGNVA